MFKLYIGRVITSQSCIVPSGEYATLQAAANFLCKIYWLSAYCIDTATGERYDVVETEDDDADYVQISFAKSV